MERLTVSQGRFPSDIQQDLQQAGRILLDYGADTVILYGSLARGDYHAQSDIDLCVQGLPDAAYFAALAHCLLEIERPVSVLDFANSYGYLRERILAEGKIIGRRDEMLRQEIGFGLENLEQVYQTVVQFDELDSDPPTLRLSALTYECFGYYNAVEHLMIRFLKYQRVELPQGKRSHQQTLREFRILAEQSQLSFDLALFEGVATLMSFRHVATKIYSFLIDEAKLSQIVEQIKQQHLALKALFSGLLALQPLDDASLF